MPTNFSILQAVFKNMTHLGLLPTFRENQAFTLWLELCMALPLLPEHDIEEAWNELKTMPLPDMPIQAFSKFKAYITKTWIQQRLNVLSVYGQVRVLINMLATSCQLILYITFYSLFVQTIVWSHIMLVGTRELVSRVQTCGCSVIKFGKFLR